MVKDSWFSGLWRGSWKRGAEPEKLVIGMLCFEVASLMSKVVHLWQCLKDDQVVKMREEIMNSVGVRKLVSDDDEFLVGLVCAEFVENLCFVARSVARIGMRCKDPVLQRLDNVFDDSIKNYADLIGWEFSWKRMEKMVRKMEKYIATSGGLFQEMEVLNELENALRRMMQGSGDANSANRVEIHKKYVWQRQEVKHLKENSLWNKSYDDVVRLLASSIFTIFRRIKDVFGFNQGDVVQDVGYSRATDVNYLPRSRSISALMQSSVHPSESNLSRFSSGPIGRSPARSGPLGRPTTKSGPLGRPTSNSGSLGRPTSNSGPLGRPTSNSGPLGRPTSNSGPLGRPTSNSGPLGRPTSNSGPLGRPTSNSGLGRPTSNSGPLGRPTMKSGRINSYRQWLSRDNSSNKHPSLKTKRLATAGPFKGCMMVGNKSPVLHGYSPAINGYSQSNGVYSGILSGPTDGYAETIGETNILLNTLVGLNSKWKLSIAPPSTLGGAALALHYANVVIVIEKLVQSPHLIGPDARDDLYSMLPQNVRASLRASLKSFVKTTSSFYDTDLAADWNEALARILEWLAPLAHNMIRWQSERTFQQQHLISRTNVLLVQTLFFADQAKTESAITELLVGLNYLWRFGRELNAKALLECVSSGEFDDYLDSTE